MSSETNHSESPTDSDVIVIGGGIIGCFTAVYLLQRGRKVTILERDGIGSGASMGNCGYVCPSHLMPLCGPGVVGHSLPGLLTGRGALSIPLRFDPTLWKWLVQFTSFCTPSHQASAAVTRHALLGLSMELYREFLARSDVACQWQDRGLLMVHRTRKTFDAFAVMAGRLEREFGLSVDPYADASLNALEPSLVEGLAGGWYFPADAHLHPGRLMQELHRYLSGRGARILEGVEVREMNVHAGQITRLETSAGTMRGEQYIVTTGAEAPRFAKPLGCHIPIVPGKGYSMNFAADASSPRLPMIFQDSHVAVTPLGTEFRVGSTMQLMGYDRAVDPRRVRMIRDNAQTYLKSSLPSEPLSSWSGWRPMMPDDLPCIDRAPAVANAFVASGNGMIGISTATATGKLVAQLACGDAPCLDPAPFSLHRFLSKRQQRLIVSNSSLSTSTLSNSP